jgi:hypothetical protein
MRLQPSVGILRRQLEGQESRHDSARDLSNILKRIRSRYSVEELISEVTKSTKKAAQLVGQAYHHNNGFDRIVIDSISEFGLKLRLHVWWNGGRSADESNIHNHSWNFASSVIFGVVTMKRYVESGGSDATYTKARYATLARAKANARLTIEGHADLRCVSEKRFEANSLYSLSHADLHSVVMPPCATATLVLQGRHAVQFTTVYAKELNQLRNPYHPRYFSRNEILNKLTRLKTFCRSIE